MAAGDPAGAGLDHGTAALRRLMVRAAEDEVARGQALAAVSLRPVLVATWPHSPESVRTLTNSDGEQAMPLFTGMDVLIAAARRFGWTSPDGSVSHRELEAAEALRGAVANAVHFVVLDICADHSVEFARDEIEVLVRSSGLQAPRVDALAAAPAQARQAPLNEIDSPFGRERTTGLTAIVEESVANRPGRGTRPDPRAEPSLATPLGAVAVARVAVPIAARSAATGTPALGAMRRPERVTTPLAFDAVQQTQPLPPRAEAKKPPTPPPFAAVQPEPPPPPRPAPRAPTPPPFDAIGPTDPPAMALPAAPVELPALDAADGFPLAEAPADGGFGFGLVSEEEPEAKPAALEAAAMMQQIGKMAGDAATQQAAADVASMLKQMAMKGGVDEEKPSAAQNAAKALAAMLMGSAGAAQPAAAVAPAAAAPAAVAASPAPKTKRGKPKGEARPASSGTMKAVAAPEPAADCVLGPLETPLEDALLGAIADGLRKYPEIEWACELSDGTKVPVIGVRVAGGFMTNVPEIKSAIVRAGDAHGARLSVLLLNDGQQMKEARSQGSVFFPWRKRAKK